MLCRFNGATISNSLTIGGNGGGYGAIYTLPTSCGSGGAGATSDEPNVVVSEASVNWNGGITLTAGQVALALELLTDQYAIENQA